MLVRNSGESMGHCRNCSAAIDTDTEVRLWDGKSYCRECVEAACPGLASFARDNPILKYRAEFRFWRSFRTVAQQFALLCYGVTFLAGIVISAVLVAGNPVIWKRLPLGIVLFPAIMGTPLWLLFMFLGILLTVYLRIAAPQSDLINWPATRVCDGIISTNQIPKSCLFASAPLQECEWCLKEVRRDEDLGWNLHKRLALIIKFKGYTVFVNRPEEIRRWAAFLQLADVPRM